MDYEFQIVSKDKKSDGEVFRAFELDELDEPTIGVKKNEPFEIVFNNRTSQPVQVRISLDGTDIITGEPASTSPNGDMWYVKGYGDLVLSAWPETQHGGARFVFTSEDKSVAVNTHGDTSGQGIIAAAVYIENEPYYSRHLRRTNAINTLKSYNRVGDSRGLNDTYSYNYTLGNGNLTSGVGAYYQGGETFDSGTSFTCDVALIADDDKNLAIGAGEQVDQEITKVAGLRRPVLDDILELHYMPWAKLEKILSSYTITRSKTAFPGDSKGINLKGVPRVRSTARGATGRRTSRRTQQWERFAAVQ